MVPADIRQTQKLLSRIGWRPWFLGAQLIYGAHIHIRTRVVLSVEAMRPARIEMVLVPLADVAEKWHILHDTFSEQRFKVPLLRTRNASSVYFFFFFFFLTLHAEVPGHFFT